MQPTVAWHWRRFDACPPLGTRPQYRTLPLRAPRTIAVEVEPVHPRVLWSVKDLRGVFILTVDKIHLLFIFGLAWPDDCHGPVGHRGRCGPPPQ